MKMLAVAASVVAALISVAILGFTPESSPPSGEKRPGYGPEKTISLTAFPKPSSPLTVCKGTVVTLRATLSDGLDGVVVAFLKDGNDWKEDTTENGGIAEVDFETANVAAGTYKFQAKEYHDGYGTSNEVEVTVLQVEIAMEPDQLWYFCDEPAPDGYSVTSTVTATVTPADQQGTYQWTVSAANGEAVILADGDEVTSITTEEPSITLASKGMSESLEDVQVTVTFLGCSAVLATEVRQPERLEDGVVHYGYGGAWPYGYVTQVTYILYDNMGDVVPNMPVNEQFGKQTHGIYAGENWSFDPTQGSILTDGTGEFVDQISKAPSGNPLPLWPGPLRTPPVALSDVEIDNMVQVWRAGSSETGKGCVVQTGLIRRYLDHADVTPPEE